MLSFRKATMEDAKQYFEWINDKEVRENSYHSAEIHYEKHIEWFEKKINSINCLMLYFENENKIPIGQVRIEMNDKETVIGISVDAKQRGKSYATQLLIDSTDYFFSLFPEKSISAYIKKENTTSYKNFLAAGFVLEKEEIINGFNSYKMIKQNVSL